MLAWLKKHFIPHDDNEHRPHLLRGENMRRVIVLVVALEIIAFILPSIANLNLSGGMAAVLPAVLGELTNQKRAEAQLPTLTINPLLQKAAEMKAQDMAKNGYFAHVSPEGKTPWHWIELAGYKYQYAGENLAVNFRDSEDVTAAWLNSPTHRANIVKGKYTEMGTGVARGLYKGKNTVFVVQVYANPLPQAVVVSEIIPTDEVVSAPQSEAQVLGSEITPSESSLKQETRKAKISEKLDPWQKIFASPRQTTNALLAAIFVLIAIALILYTVIKMRGHHPDILGNGLAVLAVIGALFIANYYLSFGGMEVAEGYGYALEETL